MNQMYVCRRPYEIQQRSNPYCGLCCLYGTFINTDRTENKRKNFNDIIKNDKKNRFINIGPEQLRRLHLGRLEFPNDMNSLFWEVLFPLPFDLCPLGLSFHGFTYPVAVLSRVKSDQTDPDKVKISSSRTHSSWVSQGPFDRTNQWRYLCLLVPGKGALVDE